MRHSSPFDPGSLAVGDRRYHWRAIRLRLMRRLLRFWPLWLILLIVSLIESAARQHFGADSPLLAWWDRLDLLGLGFAGATGLAIWTGFAIEAYLKTSARPPRRAQVAEPNGWTAL
jgi:hypothetical protein